MKISIIIPVINLWKEYTFNCINSLIKQNLPEDYKIDFFIIDNGSTDETKEICQSKMLETVNLSAQGVCRVRYLYFDNKENIGVANSWNLGIKKAIKEGANYVFVINNDTVFQENCVKNLIERFQKGDLIMISPINQPLELFDKNNLCVDEINECDYSAFMIDKRLFELVGEFDEGFEKAYFEDNSMQRRINLSNLKSIKYPMAIYSHFGSRTQNQKPEGIVSHDLFRQNREYYIRKWGGPPRAEVYKNPFNDSTKSIKWTKQNNE